MVSNHVWLCPIHKTLILGPFLFDLRVTAFTTFSYGHCYMHSGFSNSPTSMNPGIFRGTFQFKSTLCRPLPSWRSNSIPGSQIWCMSCWCQAFSAGNQLERLTFLKHGCWNFTPLKKRLPGKKMYIYSNEQCTSIYRRSSISPATGEVSKHKTPKRWNGATV